MVVSGIVAIVLIFAVAGLCQMFPAFNRFVTIVNHAGLFLVITVWGLRYIGDFVLSLIGK
jgi:hypothetical protein